MSLDPDDSPTTKQARAVSANGIENGWKDWNGEESYIASTGTPISVEIVE
ncbi:hypothetical protein Hsar01_00520 [Haloferula sargassicola]|uniref:Uncharacterized protein n=1 Tax=Haloferula sargassicola TaxID=490096 RepID=A0ABP9UI37_9BACT